MSQLWTLENELYENGVKLICGVDEAGRGPLAGPVYAAAVILPRNTVIDGLNDSKKLSEKKREALFDEICKKALSFGIARAEVEEIEELNILNATYLAMNRAISKLELMPELALIDGNRNTGIHMDSMCVVKGDSKCADIAAASILARAAFLKEMKELSKTVNVDLLKGASSSVDRQAVGLIKSYGFNVLHDIAKLKFANTEKIKKYVKDNNIKIRDLN